MRSKLRRNEPAARRVGRFLLLALAAAACRTTTEQSPVGAHEFTPTRAALQETWRVQSGLELQGYVARYTSDETPPRTYFVVRNGERQDVGFIDSFGRAWRYQPHERESEWLTTGTVLQGARAILSASADACLVPADEDGAAPN